MTLDLPIIFFLLAGVCFFVESIAMNCWAKWTFKGPRFRKRIFEIKSSERGYAEFDQLLVKDKDIKMTGFRLKVLRQGYYLVQIPPRAPKISDDMPFPSFLTGELSIDTDARRATLTIRFMPGGMTFLNLGLAALLIRAYMAGEYAFMIVVTILWSLVLVYIYIFAYDSYIDDFCSVLMGKLNPPLEESN